MSLEDLQGSGFQDRSSELFAAVYEEIRRLAHRWLAGKESAELSPTDLVHEAYLRMRKDRKVPEDRQKFLGYAALALRRTIVDHARSIRAKKRGGGVDRVPLSQVFADGRRTVIDLLELEDLLVGLEAFGQNYADIVTLRFILGCSVSETASSLRISEPKVKKDWTFARSWLRVQLQRQSDDT